MKIEIEAEKLLEIADLMDRLADELKATKQMLEDTSKELGAALAFIEAGEALKKAAQK